MHLFRTEFRIFTASMKSYELKIRKDPKMVKIFQIISNGKVQRKRKGKIREIAS